MDPEGNMRLFVFDQNGSEISGGVAPEAVRSAVSAGVHSRPLGTVSERRRTRGSRAQGCQQAARRDSQPHFWKRLMASSAKWFPRSLRLKRVSTRGLNRPKLTLPESLIEVGRVDVRGRCSQSLFCALPQ
jgi:hypothetical protein